MPLQLKLTDRSIYLLVVPCTKAELEDLRDAVSYAPDKEAYDGDDRIDRWQSDVRQRLGQKLRQACQEAERATPIEID